MKTSFIIVFALLLVGCASTRSSASPARQSDASTRFEEIKIKAEKGDAKAQGNLGACYYNGEGVTKDAAEAVKWYRKAADQGDAIAQFNLGCCYSKGSGVPQDYTEAVKWHRKAAEQDFVGAQINLSRCYYFGQGVAKDEAETVKWLRKVAEQNHADAQYSLRLCYASGRGVAKDAVEAVKWLRKAAEGGEVQACNGLAWILATSKNSEIRNGSNAVVFAEKGAAATNRKTPAVLDTLAAAYAEAGQFEKAVSTEQKAIALLQAEAEKNEYRTRLKLFEAHLPYRAKD